MIQSHLSSSVSYSCFNIKEQSLAPAFYHVMIHSQVMLSAKKLLPSSSEHTGVSSAHIYTRPFSVCLCLINVMHAVKINRNFNRSRTKLAIEISPCQQYLWSSPFFSVSEKKFSTTSNLPKAEACRLSESTSQWVAGSIDGAGRALALFACSLMHVRLVFISLHSLPSTSCTGNHSFGFTSTT